MDIQAVVERMQQRAEQENRRLEKCEASHSWELAAYSRGVCDTLAYAIGLLTSSEGVGPYV